MCNYIPQHNVMYMYGYVYFTFKSNFAKNVTRIYYLNKYYL